MMERRAAEHHAPQPRRADTPDGRDGGDDRSPSSPRETVRAVAREDERASAREAGRRANAERDQAVAVLWLAVWQRIAGRAAHEVKNALNGVSVNLEVVRSRLARSAADPSAAPSATAVRFAEVASAQFELLTVLSEALLALARPARAPADVAQLLAPLAVLLDAVARSEGGSLITGGLSSDGSCAVVAPPMAVRLALAASLDAAVGRGRAVTCRVERGREIRVRVAWDGEVPASPLAQEIVATASDAGIGVDVSAHAVTLTFVPVAAGEPPSPAGTPAPDGRTATPNSDP